MLPISCNYCSECMRIASAPRSYNPAVPCFLPCLFNSIASVLPSHDGHQVANLSSRSGDIVRAAMTAASFRFHDIPLCPPCCSHHVASSPSATKIPDNEFLGTPSRDLWISGNHLAVTARIDAQA